MVSAGGALTCAILDNNTVKCWGYNGYGQIGDGSTDHRNSPAAVDLGASETAMAISTGKNHACAILNDNSLKCWGYNNYGTIGNRERQ